MSRVCPKCKTKTYVSDTRYRPDDDYTYRRHECQNKKCGFVFSTAEVIIIDGSNGQSLISRLRTSLLPDLDADRVRIKRLCKEILDTVS